MTFPADGISGFFLNYAAMYSVSGSPYVPL